MNVYRYFILVCLLAAMTACSDMQPAERPHELSFSLSGMTKGIVDGGTMYDSDEASWRDLLVTAHLRPAAGQQFSERPYFTAEMFSRTAANKWSHSPAIYWPVGGTLDIMALSTTLPLLEPDVAWFSGNAADGVRVAVSRHHSQDDLMYGALWGVGSSSSATALEMNHSQALIEVKCRRSGGVAARLDSILLNKVYMEGDLEVLNNVGAPTMSWNFRRFRAYDVLVDDMNGAYGNPITSTASSVKMLIPEQEKTSITIIYTVAGQRRVHTQTLAHERWLAGKKYQYELNFVPVTSTAAPSQQGLFQTKAGGNELMITETETAF